MRQFNNLLNQPELMMLNARAHEASAADKIWRAIAPDNLSSFSHAAGIKNHQLTLITYNNSVAAKIKLLVPSLLIKLEKQGLEVTAIRIKVQVKYGVSTHPKKLKTLSPKAIDSLNRLSRQLNGTSLGDAISKITRNAIKS